MKLNNWKIYDKKGSPLNWYADPYLPLSFSNSGVQNAKGASGYLITDPSGIIIGSQITASGYNYAEGSTVSYKYVFGDDIDIDITSDVSIFYKDVSVFNPEPTDTKGIGYLTNIDISTNETYPFPSTTYSSAIFLEPVSKGLVETEHLFIFEQLDSSLVRPYDTSAGTLILQMYGDENEIQFFTVDSDTEEVIWTDTLVYELNEWSDSTPININIGFRSDDEGVFERRMRILNVVGENYYLMAEIVVNAESIGEDERFRALLNNFGLPDPKDFPTLFKEADINEALPDYKVVNPKSKQMILEHDNIVPFIGTYKGLINAIKWLGYDDVYIREWFKNVKENKKISLVVPFDAKDRTKTILKFSAEERRSLKKLNQLSLNYCITRETGDIDDWGTPETENCYSYTIEEVFAKLVSLKKWLEKNIIGVNARIIDITGEGVYFERFKNLVYVTDNRGSDYRVDQSLTPYTLNDGYSELIQGEASIYMTLKEFELTSIKDSPYRISDYTSIIWDPSTDKYFSPDDKVWDPSTYYYFRSDSSIYRKWDPSVPDSSILGWKGSYVLTEEASTYLSNPDKFLELGPPPSNPFVGITDIQWKASVSKPFSGVISDMLVTNPLWVYDNKLRFYNIFDTSTIFYDLHNYPSPDASTPVNLDIILEKAYIRDASNVNWDDSIQYSIYPDSDPSMAGVYIMESSLGDITRFGDYVNLSPTTNGLLQFANNENLRAPLLSFKNFRGVDINENYFTFETDKLYNLDILDGKISMGTNPENYQSIDYYINYYWDYETNEQIVRLNIDYISPRMPIYDADPSTYFWADPVNKTGGGLPLYYDNSIYVMNVNHIGDYEIDVNVWDGYNTLFTNPILKPHKVYVKNPKIDALIKNRCITSSFCSNNAVDVSIVNNIIENNNYPIYDRYINDIGLYLRENSTGTYYIDTRSLSHFQDLPSTGTIYRFQNTTEQAVSLIGNDLTVNKMYQDFLNGDEITLINTYKGTYDAIRETTANITNIIGETLTLDNIPSSFKLDTSHNIYVLNTTLRDIYNIDNQDSSAILIADVSGYTFLENQLVNLVIFDSCIGKYFGSSYRVTDVSSNRHTFNNALPSFIVNDLTRYNVYAQHAWGSYAMFEMDTSYGLEVDNSLNLYINNDHRQYYIDSTFVMFQIPFSHERSTRQWYDASDGLIIDASVFYSFDKPITIGRDSFVLLRSNFDVSNYMIDEKHIWTVGPTQSEDVTFRVYNDYVPFKFDNPGYYDILVETYDKYGNLSYNLREGFIKVN